MTSRAIRRTSGPVNTVFQTYALFPFMTVWDNVAFGLKYQKASKEDTKRRVGEALELARMSDFAKRRPAQLSGGQQQRVALARALVLRPQVLLLDEPLGALDAKLRKQLQLELRAVQREVGITFVYVTHDQEEALTMSDQIAVLAEGRIEQVGPPQEIYSAPATTFVAGFLGAANIFDAEVLEAANGSAVCSALDTRLGAAVEDGAEPGEAAIVIRPERITRAGRRRAGRAGAQRHRRCRLAGGLPRPLHAGARRRRRARRADRGGAQPFGPGFGQPPAGGAGQLRLHPRRGARAAPQLGVGDHRPGGRRPWRAQRFLTEATVFSAGRLSSRSANRMAMS